MARNVPDRELTEKQVWAHINTGERFLIVGVDDTVAYCVLPTNTKMGVAIPHTRFKDWGNRGFRFEAMKKGAMPKIKAKFADFPDFQPKGVDFGAREL
jgi:hypothetical protein